MRWYESLIACMLISGLVVTALSVRDLESIADSHNEQIVYCEQQIETLTEQIEALQSELTEANDFIGGLIDDMQDLKDEYKAIPQSTNTEQPELELLGTFSTTGYCQCSKCCGQWAGMGLTASGAKAEPGVTVAADWSVIPKGTRIYIEGVGERIVQDRGGAVKGNVIDVMYDTHQQALNHGRKNAKVYLIKEV